MSRKGQGVYLCYGTSDSPPNLRKFQSKVAEGKIVPKMYMRSRDKPRDLGPSLYALHCIAMTKLLAITVQNYTKIIISSLSDCTSPCLVLTKSPQISVQNKLLACSLEVIIEMTSSFLKNRDFCFGGKFKLVKIF